MRKSAVKWLIIAVLVAGLNPPAAPADAATCHAQCTLGTFCLYCEFLWPLIISCETRQCNFCVNDFCPGFPLQTPHEELSRSSSQLASHPQCTSTRPDDASLQGPRIRVVQVDWLTPRT